MNLLAEVLMELERQEATYFFSGSFVVPGTKPNDIDIVVHDKELEFCHLFSAVYGFEPLGERSYNGSRSLKKEDINLVLLRDERQVEAWRKATEVTRDYRIKNRTARIQVHEYFKTRGTSKQNIDEKQLGEILFSKGPVLEWEKKKEDYPVKEEGVAGVQLRWAAELNRPVRVEVDADQLLNQIDQDNANL
jgi:hypothetical protein